MTVPRSPLRGMVLDPPYDPTVGKGGGYYPSLLRVINLPPPDWFGDGYEVVQAAPGKPERYVISDGTDYRDENGDVIAEPHWLPYGCVLHADFINARFWWNGAVKSLSDLTVAGSGYTLPFASVGAAWTGGFALATEVQVDPAAGLPTGSVFGWRNSSTATWVNAFTTATSSGVNRAWQTLIGNPGSITTYSMQALITDPNGADLTVGKGINRSVWTVPSNANSRSKALGRILTGDSVNGSIVAPTGLLNFNRSATDGSAPTNVTLRSVSLWCNTMSDDQLKMAVNPGLARPKHIPGDSFLTHGNLRQLLKNLTDSTGLVIYTQDGIGGTTMTQQAVRYLSRPEFWDSDLIWMDGSLEVDGPTAIAAIQSVQSVMRPGTRLLYVQSNPINGLNDPTNRNAWIAKDAQIRSYLGEDQYCPTLDIFLANGNGSTEDNNRIANGQWPYSLCEDLTHPTTAGAVLLAQIIHDRMVALDMLQGF